MGHDEVFNDDDDDEREPDADPAPAQPRLLEHEVVRFEFGFGVWYGTYPPILGYLGEVIDIRHECWTLYLLGRIYFWFGLGSELASKQAERRGREREILLFYLLIRDTP